MLGVKFKIWVRVRFRVMFYDYLFVVRDSSYCLLFRVTDYWLLVTA